jgi:hypothetical protein
MGSGQFQKCPSQAGGIFNPNFSVEKFALRDDDHDPYGNVIKLVDNYM